MCKTITQVASGSTHHATFTDVYTLFEEAKIDGYTHRNATNRHAATPAEPSLSAQCHADDDENTTKGYKKRLPLETHRRLIMSLH